MQLLQLLQHRLLVLVLPQRALPDQAAVVIQGPVEPGRGSLLSRGSLGLCREALKRSQLNLTGTILETFHAPKKSRFYEHQRRKHTGAQTAARLAPQTGLTSSELWQRIQQLSLTGLRCQKPSETHQSRG